MKTLVIHPKDPTTDFLSEIYKNKDWTIVNDNSISSRKLYLLIKEHDRIIMLGHGSPLGLLKNNGFIIDSSWVYLLREKECIGIWCHADKFFTKYGLRGLYSGMIISELAEAYYYQILCPVEEINESNRLLSESLRDCIEDECEDINYQRMLTNLITQFDTTTNNPIIEFNRNNLFIQL